MKKTLITILITFVITASVTVYAAGILASDISFTPKNTSWTKENGEPINNVEDALNELYSLKKIDNVENLNKITDGVEVEGDYYYLFENNNNIQWDSINNVLPSKIILCYKIAGNNKNFIANLPFSIDDYEIVIKKLLINGNQSWIPRYHNSKGNVLNVDVNYGYPETAEYFFAVYLYEI